MPYQLFFERKIAAGVSFELVSRRSTFKTLRGAVAHGNRRLAADVARGALSVWLVTGDLTRVRCEIVLQGNGTR